MLNTKSLEEYEDDMAYATVIFEEYEDEVGEKSPAERDEIIRGIAEYVPMMREVLASPSLREMDEAHRCEAAFDWAGAEAAYLRAVAVEEEGRSGPYSALSSFYHVTGRREEALQAAHNATEACRSSGASSFLVFRLIVEASLLTQAGDLQAAGELLAEAEEAFEKEPISELQGVHVKLARCELLLEQGLFTRAEAGLDEIVRYLESVAVYRAAGNCSALAQYSSMAARLLSEAGDRQGAVNALSEAVRQRRTISQVPHIKGLSKVNSLATVLLDLGRAQEIIGDPMAAESLAESRAVRESIGLPPLA